MAVTFTVLPAVIKILSLSATTETLSTVTGRVEDCFADNFIGATLVPLATDALTVKPLLIK